MPDRARTSLRSNRLKLEEVDAADSLHRVKEAQNDLRWIDTSGTSLDHAGKPIALVGYLLEWFEVLSLEYQDVLEHEDGDVPICSFADKAACRGLFASVTNLQVARQVVGMDLASMRL